jgi:hypothetical protein
MYEDSFIEKMATYYTSFFVKKNMPWITEITFEEFLFREYLKKKN